MRLICFFSCFLLFSAESWACWCHGLKPLNAQILERYQYVALVRVKTLTEFTIPGPNARTGETAKLTVDIIENFKNTLPDELILDGYNTSCDMGLRPGQEWIIFARESNGYATVFACGYSILYEGERAVQDVSQLRYWSGDELVNRVRQLTGKPIQAANNRLEKFYSNGQRALLTTYRDGSWEEERVLWHANGQLWGKEFYRNGLKNGPSLWWNANGTPLAKETFVAGVAIDTSRYWHIADTDAIWDQTTPNSPQKDRDLIKQFNSRSNIQSIVIADRQGRRLNSQSFNRQGWLQSEVVGVPETDVECRTSFDKSGKINELTVFRLSYTTPDEPEHQTVYSLTYQEDGSRRGAYYDAKGRLTRYTLVKDGIETVLEEKHYPD